MMDSLLLYKILKNRTGAEISASGNPAIMSDTLKNNPMNEMKVFGWSKQERTTGAQLFDASRFDGIEQYGVSLTVEDGVIYAEGTPTQNAWITAKLTADEIKKVFKNGKITIKSEKVDNCNFTVGLYFEFIPTSFAADGSSIELTLPEKITDGCIYYYVNLIKDTEMIGGRKIMLYQYGDGTYEPYTGGQPSPSPDYPQEIVSAGMKWSTGINLFDISQAEIGKSTSWGATAGTEIMVYNSKIECLTIIDVLPSTTYTVKNFTPGKIWLSRIIEANEEGLGYVNHKHYNNLEQALIQKTITTSANTTKLYISMQTIDGANISADTLKDVQIMIVQGDAIGDYEPYDDGMPKRYGDKINIGVDVDIFDRSKEEKGYVTSRGEISVQSRYKEYYIPMQSIMSGQQNLSVKMIGGSKPWVGVGFYDEDKKFLSRTTGYPELAYDIKIPVKAKYMILSYTTLDVESIEIKYSSPQQSLSIQTPTGLPAIPVDTDGNYTDADGQQWISDYVDLKRGKYAQRVWQKTLDGSESWGTYISTGYYLTNILPEKMHNREMLCDQLRRSDGGIASDVIIVGAFNANTSLYIENSTLRDNTLADKGLSNWKAHLAEHPLTVMTYLDEPIERDLTPEEIQAYKNLVTYAGTTIVENDAECYMEVSAGGGDALRAKKLALILRE